MKLFKHFKLIGLLAALITLSACANSTNTDTSNAENSGNLVAKSELVHDWGNINIQGGNINHRFKFTNESDESLYLKGAQTSCMCTTAMYHLSNGQISPVFGMHNNDTWSAEIKPNESFEVEAIYDPLAHGPDAVGLIQRSIMLLTSDPDQSTVELKVGGDVLYEEDFKEKEKSEPQGFTMGDFVFEEKEFDFGTIKQSGGIVSHDFKFTYEGNQAITIVGTPGSCLCTEGEISKQQFNPGEEGILTVKFNPNLHAEPEGKFFKTVTILTEPKLEVIPEVKVWTEIDLDLGEEHFELQILHNEDDGYHNESNEINHNGEITRLSTGNTHDFYLEAKEIIGKLDEGLEYAYWTFGGTVPGPMMRVKEGDTVNIHLKNAPDSKNPHSIDLHAVNGPGGGAVATQVHPGQEADYSFVATHPGLYVYHCATPDVAQHMANGMYGMILVEPKEGLPEADQEFYVMQGEVYSILNHGETGITQLSGEDLNKEQPKYIVFNGRKNSLAEESALRVKVGDKVRLYVGNGGVAKVSNFHVIGEIFDKVYVEGGSLINENVQTTIVPAGGSVIVEFIIDKPGKYLLVDHALSRLNKGAKAELIAS